jgi:hypothetical protein
MLMSDLLEKFLKGFETKYSPWIGEINLQVDFLERVDRGRQGSSSYQK